MFSVLIPKLIIYLHPVVQWNAFRKYKCTYLEEKQYYYVILPWSSFTGLVSTALQNATIMLFYPSIRINSKSNVCPSFILRIETIQQITTEKSALFFANHSRTFYFCFENLNYARRYRLGVVQPLIGSCSKRRLIMVRK